MSTDICGYKANLTDFDKCQYTIALRVNEYLEV